VSTRDPIVFLFAVDNTLLDNDRFSADLAARLVRDFGEAGQARYTAIDKEIRGQVGYADYLGVLQRLRGQDSSLAFMEMSFFLLDYPFDERRFPGVLEAIDHLRTLGRPVIMSDGDTVFQPRKIRRAGLWDAFREDVLIYVHKEDMLDDMQKRYPADHYVMVDDKPRILAAMKKAWGDRVTTVFPRQGKFANDPEALAAYPPADVTVERIGDLLSYELSNLRAGASAGSSS
jgi:FMN phosphatase YigB (HAD superfamily)